VQILQLSSFPIEQVANLEALEQDLAAWFGARDYGVRLLAYSQAFNMRPAIERVRQSQASTERIAQAVAPLLRAIDAWLAGDGDADPAPVLRQLPPSILAILVEASAAAPALRRLLCGIDYLDGDDERSCWAVLAEALDTLLWRLPWTKETVRLYDAMQQRHLRAATYLLLTWEPPDVSAQSLVTTLRHAFRRPVQPLQALPSVIATPYREQLHRLEPLEAGQPYYALLHSYDMQDVWDAATLHPLLAAPYDVALAIDILTLPRAKAQRLAELAHNAANLVAKDKRLLDMRAERVTHDSQYALHELRHQTLHEIQMAVLVGGATPDELEIHVADIRDRLGPKLRLMRAAGAQGEVLKLFSTTPRARLEAPWKPRTQLSHAVGCLAGIVGLHRTNTTDGIFLGIDAVRRAPIFMDLFKQNQAAHTVILGKTGSGKTVFLNLLAERAAAVGGMQVIGIDSFANGVRVAAALAGATCYAIGLGHTVNILDVVYGQDAEGGWLANQVLHVVGQLALLLGEPGQTPDGKKRYIPRVFSTRERGVLGRVIQELYQSRQTTPETPIAAMPILADLLARLEAEADTVALELAIDLRYLLYGTIRTEATTLTPEGAAFNGATTIDWRFGRDVVYYDFKQVPELLLPFYYLQAIGAIHRYLRQEGRDTRRKIFLEIDEFGYAAQVEAVARLAVEICKTARKYGCGIVLVDQNPLTFLESESGRQIFENASARILFHLDDIAARQVGAALSDLTPAHVAFLPQAQPGECLAVLKNDVYRLNIEMHPLEARAFLGS
jgi:hypothetical protein